MAIPEISHNIILLSKEDDGNALPLPMLSQPVILEG